MVKGLDFSNVKKITDTAGFEPLDVKLKRFMISGEVAQFHRSLFDSYDYREMFSAVPDFQFDEEDEIEETTAKVKAILEKRAEIIARKQKVLEQKEPEKEKVSVSDTPEKTEDLESKE